MKYAIGIEIGGTKLQAGVGLRNQRLLSRARATVAPGAGAQGILGALPGLVDQALHEAGLGMDAIQAIGIGFGGPVDSQQGRTLTSHQIEGWDQFPLTEWAQERWDKPVLLQNDASIAGYAEAMIGAGQGYPRVFYLTIGSGIGGGWIVNGYLDDGQGRGAAEIGHTWAPDPDTGEPEKLEHIASGWAIGARAQEALEEGETSILRQRCGGNLEQVDARMVYQAAEEDDLLAAALLDETTTALAIGIGNMITLLHPNIVVIGGGVSLMGARFWQPLRQKLQRYAFHLFSESFEIKPAALGEEVVVAGAALWAQSAEEID